MQIAHTKSKHEVQACKAQIKIDQIDRASEKEILLKKLREMDDELLRLKNTRLKP